MKEKEDTFTIKVLFVHEKEKKKERKLTKDKTVMIN